MRIDAHQHFWEPRRGDYGWMPPEDPVLSRRYLPADLAPILRSHRIDGTILVQAAPTADETEYLLGLADATDWVLGVVGWVDFDDRGQIRRLERFARHPKFAGVRPMIQDIADPGWMLRPEVSWGYRAVADLGLTFDALGFPRHLDNFARLVEANPGLRVVLDHCLKPCIAGHPQGFSDWAAGMDRLAGAGVFCKLSGLVTEAAAEWSVADLAPYAEHVLGAFGAERVLWGSDWPVCRLRAEYGDWLAAADTLTEGLSMAERAEVFGGTVLRAYRL